VLSVGRVHCIPRSSVPRPPPFWLQLLVPGRLKQHRNQKRIGKRMWKIEERRAKGMEDFPVQVIGTILSHIAAVKQVVRALGTCRKWREAARNHLQTMRCDCRKSSPVYKSLTTARLEVLLTETILQTSRLQDLYILTREGFSAGVIISWFLHARSYLRILRYGLMVRGFARPHRLHARVLDRIGKMNCLEILELFRIRVMGVEFTVQSWPSLVSFIL